MQADLEIAHIYYSEVYDDVSLGRSICQLDNLGDSHKRRFVPGIRRQLQQHKISLQIVLCAIELTDSFGQRHLDVAKCQRQLKNFF